MWLKPIAMAVADVCGGHAIPAPTLRWWMPTTPLGRPILADLNGCLVLPVPGIYRIEYTFQPGGPLLRVRRGRGLRPLFNEGAVHDWHQARAALVTGS